jgi:hypothetical protein
VPDFTTACTTDCTSDLSAASTSLAVASAERDHTGVAEEHVAVVVAKRRVMKRRVITRMTSITRIARAVGVGVGVALLLAVASFLLRLLRLSRNKTSALCSARAEV